MTTVTHTSANMRKSEIFDVMESDESNSYVEPPHVSAEKRKSPSRSSKKAKKETAAVIDLAQSEEDSEARDEKERKAL